MSAEAGKNLMSLMMGCKSTAIPSIELSGLTGCYLLWNDKMDTLLAFLSL
jgi:hypothetical protein